MKRFAPVVLPLLLLGCGPREVTVRVTIPDLDGIETPVPGMVVTFLPYDRDRVIAELEAKAPPRPHTAELDSLYGAFRAPFATYLRLSRATTRARAVRDSLVEASGEGARLGAATDSIERLEQDLADARLALDRARDELQPAISRYREAVNRWRDSTYRDYRTIVRSFGYRVIANPVADTTDGLGWGRIALTNGDWWVTATSGDPGDPHAEWYWNIKISGDTVLLDPRTGRHRPRY